MSESISSTQNVIIIKPSTFSEGLEEKRKHALSCFAACRLPHEKEEAWRYTVVKDLDLSRYGDFSDEVCIEVSGVSDDLLEKGVIVCSLQEAFEKHSEIVDEVYLSRIDVEKDFFAALNAAHWSNGVFVYVPKNVDVEETFNVVISSRGTSCVVHSVVVIDDNSSLSISFDVGRNSEGSGVKDESSFMNSIVHVTCGKNASSNCYYLPRVDGEGCGFSQLVGVGHNDSHVNWFSGCFGGTLHRVKSDTYFTGKGGSGVTRGVFVSRGNEHLDVTTNVYHLMDHTTNDIVYDGLLFDTSSAVYRGLITIAKEGQQTNSYLQNNVLKMSEKARANSIPALQIDANDVKASHGATIGQVSEEHLFYLMSRGLSREEAEHLIVRGFLETVIGDIPDEGFQGRLRELVKGR